MANGFFLQITGFVLSLNKKSDAIGFFAHFSISILHKSASCAAGRISRVLTARCLRRLYRAARLVAAVMQAKSAMPPVAAAPAAGSCGCLR